MPKNLHLIFEKTPFSALKIYKKNALFIKQSKKQKIYFQVLIEIIFLYVE